MARSFSTAPPFARAIAARALPLAALTALAASTAAAPAVLAGDPCFHDLSRPPATTGASTAIAIGDCVFGPTVSHVAVGSEVVWTNSSSQAHEVAGAHLAWGAHGKLLQPGDTIGWTFDAAGVYPYTCMIHPGMTGAIVAGEVAAPAAAAGGAGTTTSDATGGTGTTAGAAASLSPQVAAIGVAAGTAVVLVGAGLVMARRRQVGRSASGGGASPTA